MKLVVATGNKGKLAEIRDVLADTGSELVAPRGCPNADKEAKEASKAAKEKARASTKAAR